MPPFNVTVSQMPLDWNNLSHADAIIEKFREEDQEKTDKRGRTAFMELCYKIMKGGDHPDLMVSVDDSILTVKSNCWIYFLVTSLKILG